MRTVAYKDVIRAAEALFLGSRDDLDTPADQVLNTHFNRWARQLWEAYKWPEWTVAQARQFRPSWSAAETCGAPTATSAVERYHVRTGKYFQSLRAGNTGNVPMTDAGVENSVWWAECAGSYSGDDWQTGRVFSATVGTPEIVRNPDDNRYYQCHTAHTAGATFDAAKFGILTPFRRSIAYEQAGETELGLVHKVLDRDPFIFFGEAQPIEFVLGDQVYVAGSQNVVWVLFGQRPPSWTGDDYNAATSYALAAQVYDPATGNFYKSRAAGNQGNPVSDATKWELIPVPYVLQDAVAQGILGELLDTEEKPEWSAKALAKAVRLAEQEFLKLSRTQNQGAQLPMRR